MFIQLCFILLTDRFAFLSRWGVSGAEGGVQIHSAFGANLDKGLFGKTSLSFSKNARLENKGLLTNGKQNKDQKWKSQIYIKYLFSISYVKKNAANQKKNKNSTLLSFKFLLQSTLSELYKIYNTA